MRAASLVLALLLGTLGCATAPPLRPSVAANEVHVAVRTTSLAGPLDEDEAAAQAPRRVEVVMGGARGVLRPVHETRVTGECDATTEGLDVIDAVLTVRCQEEEIIVVRTRRALVVRGRNGDAQWHDLATQAITPSARVIASAE